MEKVTYIIPIHKFNKEVGDFLKNAFDSVIAMDNNSGNRIIIVGPDSVLEKAEKLYEGKETITKVSNDNTDMFAQINEAAKFCVTPYFSVLEFDDAYKNYWNNAVQEYAENASVIMPIVELLQKGAFVGFANEIAWNPSFASETAELGEIAHDMLEIFMGFNVTGALIKTEDFIAVGGLKPSLKFTAWYEFLLRCVNNGKKIKVAPKVAYSHEIAREDSYLSTMGKEISEEEGKWLIATAKEEYFFKEDRGRKFGDDSSNATND